MSRWQSNCSFGRDTPLKFIFIKLSNFPVPDNISLWILKGSDDGVQHPELLDFGLYPSSGIVNHSVPEIGYVSVLRWWEEIPTQLGPLERVNL
jgi:hypothetical protein